MKTLLFAMFISLTCPVLIWAQPNRDLEIEKVRLIKIHEADRQVHFNTDVESLLSSSPQIFITVSGGRIDKVTKAESRKMFGGYFDNAKYLEWDDLDAPIIRISNDASMGWMIVRTKVKRTQKNATGVEKEEAFIYAGIMTYEKVKGKWVRVANVSTFQPR